MFISTQYAPLYYHTYSKGRHIKNHGVSDTETKGFVFSMNLAGQKANGSTAKTGSTWPFYRGPLILRCTTALSSAHVWFLLFFLLPSAVIDGRSSQSEAYHRKATPAIKSKSRHNSAPDLAICVPSCDVCSE